MFTKDNRTENFLTQMGVDFRYTNDVAFHDLTDDWNKHNLARPIPLREDAVFEYAALMERGSAAPAPILHAVVGRHHVLDGIQRLSAAQLCGATKFSAYVVTSDSMDLIVSLRVLANARLQGRAEPMEWTRRRAVEVLVINRGMSADEVALMGGWRPSDIHRLAKTLSWGGRILEAGGPELTDTMIESVATHLSEDELVACPAPISEFLHMLKASKFSAEDAEPHLVEFFAPITKPSRRHELYVARLDEFRDQPEVQIRLHGRRGSSMPRDLVLVRNLKSVESVLDQIIADGDDLPYVDEFFRLLAVIKEKLQSIAPNPKPVKARVPADMWSKHAQD